MVADNGPVEILLVEDNPGDERLTREALREGKVYSNLHWVKDGVEAMEFLRRQGRHAGAARPDIVLLDLNLPRKDGREVLQDIKGDAELKRIPVVVLTTSSQEEDILRSYDLGANSFVQKPVTFEALVQVVKKLGDGLLVEFAAPEPAIAVFAGKRTLVLFHQGSAVFCHRPEKTHTFCGFKINDRAKVKFSGARVRIVHTVKTPFVQHVRNVGDICRKVFHINCRILNHRYGLGVARNI